jgi:hypothetical protein
MHESKSTWILSNQIDKQGKCPEKSGYFPVKIGINLPSDNFLCVSLFTVILTLGSYDNNCYACKEQSYSERIDDVCLMIMYPTTSNGKRLKVKAITKNISSGATYFLFLFSCLTGQD